MRIRSTKSTPHDRRKRRATLREIDTLDEKLTAVLERNSALWERVNDEYDEKIAANEPDMTFELNEADFDDSCRQGGILRNSSRV